MKKIFYHCQRKNFGDMLNEHIIPVIFHEGIEYSSPEECDIVSIGSILGNFIKNSNFCSSFNKNIKSKKPCFVWGTGLIEPIKLDLIRPLDILAVRGKFTGDILEYKGVYGDPGIFCDELIDPQEKKYKLGIIPHYIDYNLVKARKDNEIIINMLDNPIRILKLISQCEYVVSSALHGLIAADSLRIPNAHIKLSDNVVGNDFKFKDYYSAYDIEHFYYDEIPAISEIKNNYKITDSMIDNVKQNLRSAYESINSGGSWIHRA